MTSHTHVFAAAILAFTTMTGFACARADELVAETAHVKTSGLDLSSREGAATLRQRIAAAATQVCGYYDLRDNNAMREYNDCRHEALDAATAQAATLIARQRPAYAAGTIPPTP